MKQIYTSTGLKIMHHPDVIQKIKKGFGVPVSLQVGPTSRCNLKCSFCSNAKRKKHEDLDIKVLMNIMRKLKKIGLKTVEFTGGGDPTMYPAINLLMTYAYELELEQGMITNGVLLKEKITEQNLLRLSWLRISMNCLDYVPEVQIPKIPGTLGFSYVLNDQTSPRTLKKLSKAVAQYKPRYVRIVPNCLSTFEQQERNNKLYSKRIAKWGAPYFYQEKVFATSDNCYWCYFKPFILHDGYVYPCSSVVLHSGAKGKFHEKFRWCKIEDLTETYRKPMEPVPTKHCDHCVFKTQNDLITMLLNPQMENFI